MALRKVEAAVRRVCRARIIIYISTLCTISEITSSPPREPLSTDATHSAGLTTCKAQQAARVRKLQHTHEVAHRIIMLISCTITSAA